MGKPTAELLPWCTPCVPALWRKEEAVFFLVLEKGVEFFCDFPVYDDGIILPIPSQTSGIEIG